VVVVVVVVVAALVVVTMGTKSMEQSSLQPSLTLAHIIKKPHI
jgi:hypothetical protein